MTGKADSHELCAGDGGNERKDDPCGFGSFAPNPALNHHQAKQENIHVLRR
jgi:hypothetical protein